MLKASNWAEHIKGGTEGVKPEVGQTFAEGTLVPDGTHPGRFKVLANGD